MGNKGLGVLVFWLGILLMNLTTSIALVWLMIGLPPPGFIARLGVMSAFMPPLGAALLFVAGLIYGQGGQEAES